jgi:signal transduction histidine kinase
VAICSHAMNEAARGTRGRTLGRGWVLAYFGRTGEGARLAIAAYVIAGCAFGILSLPIALWANAQVGAVTENPGGLVIDVLPGTQDWYDGIRSGQKVAALDRADAPTGWRIITASGNQTFASVASTGTDQVRGTLPGAMLAVGSALAAIITFRRRRDLAVAWAALSVGLGAMPFLAVGSRAGADVASTVALIGPALWVARTSLSSKWSKVGLVLVAISIATAWALFREFDVDAFESVDVAARVLRLALLVAVCGGLAAPAMTGSFRRLGSLRTIDLTAGVLGSVLVAGVGLLAPSVLPLAIGVVVIGIAIYPRWRSGLGGLIDHFVVDELRERASLEATEEERARLARDLHDVPLQELSGVIRRMEVRPELQSETGPLRQIADELRAMATALRPPVLEDLGLAPALETLAATDAALPVQTSIDNRAGYRPSERAPLDVEVAIFRAAQEAVRNATLHSRGSLIQVSGSVAATLIAINVDDDGVGMSDAMAALAMRKGRLGLASMRRRMASIGGTLDFVSLDPRGLSVRIRWSK